MGSPKADETRLELTRQGRILVTVAGDCMRPTIRTGQQVWVSASPAPRIGEIALLDARGWLEIHRIIGRIRAEGRTWYLHRGDDGSLCGVVDARDVLGRVLVEGRRGGDPGAHFLGLLLRLGAVLLQIGLQPDLLAARPIADRIKRLTALAYGRG